MRIACAAVFCLISFLARSQGSTVSQEKMQQVYEEVKTPYKYGLVVVPNSDSLKMDCPSVFRKGKNWYMVYLQFGGRAYETWLAQSNFLAG